MEDLNVILSEDGIITAFTVAESTVGILIVPASLFNTAIMLSDLFRARRSFWFVVECDPNMGSSARGSDIAWKLLTSKKMVISNGGI